MASLSIPDAQPNIVPGSTASIDQDDQTPEELEAMRLFGDYKTDAKGRPIDVTQAWVSRNFHQGVEKLTGLMERLGTGLGDSKELDMTEDRWKGEIDSFRGSIDGQIAELERVRAELREQLTAINGLSSRVYAGLNPERLGKARMVLPINAKGADDNAESYIKVLKKAIDKVRDFRLYDVVELGDRPRGDDRDTIVARFRNFYHGLKRDRVINDAWKRVSAMAVRHDAYVDARTGKRSETLTIDHEIPGYILDLWSPDEVRVVQQSIPQPTSRGGDPDGTLAQRIDYWKDLVSTIAHKIGMVNGLLERKDLGNKVDQRIREYFDKYYQDNPRVPKPDDATWTTLRDALIKIELSNIYYLLMSWFQGQITEAKFMLAEVEDAIGDLRITKEVDLFVGVKMRLGTMIEYRNIADRGVDHIKTIQALQKELAEVTSVTGLDRITTMKGQKRFWRKAAMDGDESDVEVGWSSVDNDSDLEQEPPRRSGSRDRRSRSW